MSFSISNISYKYGPEQELVLKNASFEIMPGQVTAIVGPSGCGKSTLVSILSGVIPELMPNGVFEGSLEVAEDVLISVVSQSPENQLFGYGVEDAISFGIENMGLPNEEIVERVEYVLDLLNIQHLRKRSVATLSGGQRQAVCIASVLAMRPDILIMDEPVSSLDPNGKKMIQSVLSLLKESGQTTVIVDNNLDWFADIVEHVIGLIDGEVVFDGGKDVFFNDFAIQERLCVTIPQEVEIYLELAKRFPGLNKFYSLSEAKREITKLIGPAALDLAICQTAESAVAKQAESAVAKQAESAVAMQAESAVAKQAESAVAEQAESAVAKQTESAVTKPDESEEILTARGICKTFADGFHALINVDAGFAKGKVISMLGQNGSGKTTLVKHLNGLYRASKGKIFYRGQETTGKSVAQISKDIILVFQNPELMLFEETVLRELTFCARAQNNEFTEETALAVLEQYGLLAQRDEFPVNLSMGKKHLLTILSVLFSSAEVIILDEPTLGMDLHLKSQLIDIIRQLKDRGKTVIVISHEIPLVFRISDEILVLNEGVRLIQDTRQVLANCDELFARISISLPPVVLLSKYFGFASLCCDVDSFVREIAVRSTAEIPAAGLAGGI